MLAKVCESCNNEFFVKPYRFSVARYCSYACYGISCRGIVPKSAFKKGVRASPETEFKRGNGHPYYGISSPALGKHWKRTPESIKRQADKQRWIARPTTRGDKHHNWQGGISPINRRLRNRIEQKLWREAIFVRDEHTCVLCGAKNTYLNADHVKPFALFPELRLSLDNGRTLCVPCHEQTDTYKGRTRSRRSIK